jgi:hypothetical protein
MMAMIAISQRLASGFISKRVLIQHTPITEKIIAKVKHEE